MSIQGQAFYLIVSPGQNEIAQMQALGLDLEPHRTRMNDSQPGLDEKFKDTEDPLRLVFVERWADRAALQVHFALVESRQFAGELSRLASAAPEMQIYEAAPTE